MKTLSSYISNITVALSMACSTMVWATELLNADPEFVIEGQIVTPESVVEVHIDKNKTLMTIPPKFYGINIHPGSSKYEFARPDLLRALKPDAVRIMTLMRSDWPADRSGRKISPVSKGPGQFDWRELDLLVDNIVAIGAEPYLALGFGPPSWLSGAPAEWIRRPPPRARIPEYADFMATIVERYATLKSLPIRRVSIDNEPENVGYSIEDYMSLVRLAKDRIRERAPKVQVGGPTIGYAYWPQPSRERLSFAGATAEFAQTNTPFDFYDWHVYSTKPEPVLRTVETVKRAYGDRTPLVISELNRDWRYDGSSQRRSEENNTGWGSVAWLAYLYDRLQLAGVDQAFYFAWRENSLGLVDARFKLRRPNFYLFSAMTNDLGRERLAASTSDKAIGCIATRLPTGKIVALIYNRADRGILISLADSKPTTLIHSFDEEWYSANKAINTSLDAIKNTWHDSRANSRTGATILVPAGGFIVIEQS